MAPRATFPSWFLTTPAERRHVFTEAVRVCSELSSRFQVSTYYTSSDKQLPLAEVSLWALVSSQPCEHCLSHYESHYLPSSSLKNITALLASHSTFSLVQHLQLGPSFLHFSAGKGHDCFVLQIQTTQMQNIKKKPSL